MAFVPTPGQRNEATAFERLMQRGAVGRPGRGRPGRRPGRVVGDKGYRSRAIRRWRRRRGIRVTLARRRTGARGGPFDRAAHRGRNRVERPIDRLKRSRRVATRYEKRAENSLAMLTLAAILTWL